MYIYDSATGKSRMQTDDEYSVEETEAYRARIREQADRTIERANRDIERAERKIAIVETFGDDTYEDDTVLAFQKTFPSNSKVYDYVAYKVNDRWYLTGPKQSGLYYTWGGLIDFIVASTDPDNIKVWRVSEWERVI